MYDLFVATVATGRGAHLSDAATRATEARTFVEQEAVEMGLADRTASLDALLSEYATSPHRERDTGQARQFRDLVQT
ncbi:MAG: S49 family peptidase [Paracoccaceae bacterium]